MTLVPDVPRVDVEPDDDALDVQLHSFGRDVEPDARGITLLAGAELHARSRTTATVRVRGRQDGRYAVIVSRNGREGVEFVRLERDGRVFSARIVVRAGQTVHLSVVQAETAAAMDDLQDEVERGGMGAGGGDETQAEPAAPEPEAAGPEGDHGAGGGGWGGRDLGLAPEIELPSFVEEDHGPTGGGGWGGRDLGLAPDEAELPAFAEPEEEPATEEVPADGGAGERDLGVVGADDEAAEADGGAEPATNLSDLDGATPMDAHVTARMPADVFEDVPFVLTVTLSSEGVKIGRHEVGDDVTVTLRERGGIRIAVQASGFAVVEGTPSEVDAEIPGKGHPKEYAFHLVPGDEGVGRVTVTVSQQPDPTPIAVITLSTMIGPADEAPRTIVPGGSLKGVADAAAPPEELAKLPTIAIEETISRGDSVLKVTARVPGRDPVTNTVSLPGKAAYVDGVYKTLDTIRAAYKTARDKHVDAQTAVSRAEDSLRELGSGIADELFGDEVNALLWDQRDRLEGILIQTSGELDIPWEIVHLVRVGGGPRDDRSHFLGDKGVTRRLWGTKQPTDLVICRARVVAIAPQYADETLHLQGTLDEVESLRATLKVPAPVKEIETRDDVSQSIAAGFDLLHFAGHGRWRDADPRAQEIVLAAYTKDDDLSALYTDADARADLVRRAAAAGEASTPFVFLSACDVGRLQRGVTGLGGFAEVFLRAGAGVFIGCSWAVQDEITAYFAQTLYQKLIDEKLTLGDAADAARKATRREHDLTALAFTVFADPRARVTILEP